VVHEVVDDFIGVEDRDIKCAGQVVTHDAFPGCDATGDPNGLMHGISIHRLVTIYGEGAATSDGNRANPG